VTRFVAMPRSEAELRLHASTNGLRDRYPLQSALPILSVRQQKVLMGVAVAVLVLAVVSPLNTAIGLIAISTLVYLATVVYRVLLFRSSMSSGHVDVVTDAEARSLPDEGLPVYTVLVPAYREPEVVTRLLAGLAGLEYPPERLDVKILLEEDDQVTIDAVRAIEAGPEVEVVLIPAGEPRTKPKALNYGLTLARGEMVTIYDAEDRPDPLQLRRAVVAFLRHGPEVGCIQSKLSFDNIDQNLITRWFSIEYAMWFSFFLPGLVRFDAPLPLGGTSNHMRRHAVEELGGWDPHNVTEDADLGIRLHRHGYKVGVLESTTLEEANSDFVNWVKQRSRWYKGYLQTWLVHMREPRRLWRDLGGRGFLQFNLFVGGTPLLALLNPFFWTLTIVWFVGKPAVIQSLFPAPVFYTGLVCWAFGNFTIAYLSIISACIMGRAELVFAAMLSPLYWVMMSLAATKALVQLITAPSFWEKTTHGLSDQDPSAGIMGQDGPTA